VFPKRFETFIKIAVISALSFCLPVMAQEQNGWQFDSLRANSSVSKSDAQQVYEVLFKMLDRWNAHDIEGHLEVYWKSPELLVVVDSGQFKGWQQLHDSYLNGYPDRNSMRMPGEMRENVAGVLFPAPTIGQGRSSRKADAFVVLRDCSHDVRGAIYWPARVMVADSY
jgi:hypothetical protein